MAQILKALLRGRVEYCEAEAGHIMQIVAGLLTGAETSQMQCMKILVSGFACRRNRASFCRVPLKINVFGYAW